ncbi:ATP-binding protein [Arcobacter sp. YIC-464]|uniref:ATP-binding protein n=1 Tax=Arcobacter sp. YIC-464 TaxID=3376631 RepID=UPI003C144ABD
MSIFMKIFLSISITTIISISLFVNYIINIKKVEAENKLTEKIEYHKKINKDTIAQLLFDLNKNILTTNLNALSLDEDILKIELIDFSEVVNILIDKRIKLNGNSIKSSIPLKISNEQLGTLNIYYSNASIQNTIERYKEAIINATIMVLILLLGIIYYFVSKTIKSINYLSHATEQISSGNLDFEINLNSKDEIAKLAQNFDKMRNSLKNRIDTINQQLDFQHQLIESINIPIFIKDDTLTYVNCNNSFAKFYGKTKEEIIGSNITIFKDNALIEEQREIDFDVLKKEKPKSKFCKIKNFKNNVKDIIIYKNFFKDEKTNTKLIIGTYLDITEINKAKEKIEKFNEELQQKVYERTEELEESNEELQTTINNLKQTQDKLVEAEKLASLGSLVAGVAHEINTPVGIGLTGITHLLEETKKINLLYKEEKMTQEDFEKYLNVSDEISKLVNSNLERTAQLVKSFKQISVDQTSEDERKFFLDQYIYDILFSLNNIIKKNHVIVNIDTDEDIELYSYPGYFSQIITNLLINSIKHGFKDMNDGEIYICLKKENNQLLINYKDNGKGIKEEHLTKIFEPFFTTNRDSGSTGLGLNIIYNIITSKLNGTITCNSKENEGVEFLIKINLS